VSIPELQEFLEVMLLQGNISIVEDSKGTARIRFDFTEGGDGYADDQLSNLKEALEDSGWRLVNSQVEHDCITGTIEPTI
jgi:hypothetical protein